MKKLIYLCGMMLLSLNMMAQIDLNDQNWNDTLIEDFIIPGRTWNTLSFLSSDKLWRAYPGHGVSNNVNHQIYQFSNCHFNDEDDYMELVAEYDTCHIIPDTTQWYLPSWMHKYPPTDNLFYFSGEIDYVDYRPQTHSITQFQFGYFEIRCKLPTHPGAHPCFWLQHADPNPLDPYYEEIDIVEYSHNLMHKPPYGANPNPPVQEDYDRVYTTAICHNLIGDTLNHNTDNYAMDFPVIPHSSNNLNGWHTFSCEWMPDHVYWYRDGELINSYYDVNHIPKHPLTLKTSYAIDGYALRNGKPEWKGTDEMVVDYIKVYQLNWDCDTDVTITCQNDLANYDYKVKKSVAITSSVEEVEIASTQKITCRVADSFEITGPFQADSGCEFTIIRQDCPE